MVYSACSAGDSGSILGSGRSPGEGNSNPLQYFCLENPTDRGAWQATVHGVVKSWIRLSNFTLIENIKKAFLSLLPVLWNSEFNWIYLYLSLLPFASLLFSAICKASLVFLHFASCLFAFLFPWDDFGHRLLYNVMNLSP